MNKNHPRRGDEHARIRTIIHQTMEIWQRNSNLQLQEVHESSPADILIDFARGNHGDSFDFTGAGGSLGMATTNADY